MPTMRNKLAYLLAAGASVAAIATVTTFQGQADTPAAIAAPAAVEVDVAPVVARPVVDWQSYSGRLEAVERVDIRPRVSGPITEIHFRNGALVKKGDPLFTIDPEPYKAEVARAEAQLAAAQARARYADAEMARASKLVADSTITRRTLDEREHNARDAAANVRAAEAALKVARLDLGYTNVTAPISGRVSRAEITVGNMVAAGATAQPLTTIVSVSPIYAAFDVDEQTYLRHIASVKDESGVPVQLGLTNESDYSRRGTVEHVDNRLDAVSGTIRVRASFNNEDGVLVPGLFARIKVGGSDPQPAVMVDERAIGTDQDKKFVLVVGDDNKVAYRRVELGSRQEGLRIVTSGLKAGERIVVNGLQRARPGDQVQPRTIAMESVATQSAQAGLRGGDVAKAGDL
ncbi:efflux RND transporter periplasmic adaptor subunit [Niveispirillum irakense]|uniref:efflux RND transporter periplasmic adaptor subunit n=1 Tax=Niveispirillum irakense TaxID=34011 RepID=UPI0004048979|nr:efflux RND transporter periplasmic adaptor subunit [Niveispirillum irakense]